MGFGPLGPPQSEINSTKCDVCMGLPYFTELCLVKMSKFRARQLDASKPIPIYLQEDIQDYTDFHNATNRTVPQMPTGMEKEEESVRKQRILTWLRGRHIDFYAPNSKIKLFSLFS